MRGNTCSIAARKTNRMPQHRKQNERQDKASKQGRQRYARQRLVREFAPPFRSMANSR